MNQILNHYFGIEVPNNGPIKIPTIQPFNVIDQPRMHIKSSGDRSIIITSSHNLGSEDDRKALGMIYKSKSCKK